AIIYLCVPPPLSPLFVSLIVIEFFTVYVGIHVFEALTGREIRESGAFRHHLDVVSLTLSNAGLSNHRLLAFTDKNHDLYITSVRGPQAFIPV
ncbi:hypothetical protein AB9K17_23655, partial [Salmonella enterica subsp. enterica serovar Kentucky]|uniref:hypothetical protein n=1 Tax=Salmonella enterica TaxID=28901 RepID=UPI003F4B6348